MIEVKVGGLNAPGVESRGVDWLLVNVSHIEIGYSGRGNHAAWLIDKTGGLIVTLACRNVVDGQDGDRDGPVSRVRPFPPSGSAKGLFPDRGDFTPEAWEVVDELSAAAAAAMAESPARRNLAVELARVSAATDLSETEWAAILDALEFTSVSFGVVSDQHLRAKVKVEKIVRRLPKNA